MAHKGDSVFQVSLTELAFTLVLLMLLLLGWRLADSFKEIKAQEEVIRVKNDQIRALDKKLEQFMDIRYQAGGICRLDPEDPLEPMMPCIKCVSVAGKLSKDDARKSIDLGKKVMEQWNALSDDKNKFQEFERKVLDAANKIADGKTLITNEEQLKMIAEAEKAIEERNSLEKRNEKLSTQNAYLQRLAGLGDPPCWISAESYRPQYLLDVTIKPDSSYVVKPFWPKEREDEALRIPGVAEMVKMKHLSKAEFSRESQKILNYAKSTNLESCRYFVRMTNEISDRKKGDMARLTLENYFYKYEVIK